MLLTITSTASPATDLGYLLHKNPASIYQRELSFGNATVVYPEADEHRCTAALIVDIDPVRLVRKSRRRRGGSALTLSHYVNDRPYVASSFMSVALSKVYGTAMTGRCSQRPELATTKLPLTARLPAVPARGGPALVARLFEPLGYEVEANEIVLDEQFPEWGPSPYVDLTLTGRVRVKDLLEHLFVLLPVLDDHKHYWVGKDEIDKLLHKGGDWLPGHPDNDLILRRYLRYDRELTRDAVARLLSDAGGADPESTLRDQDGDEAEIERPVRLNDLRLDAVVTALEGARARSVVDLGCGQGALLRRLLKTSWIDRVVGVDVSWRALETAARRLRIDEMAPRQRERIDVWQGAATYRDKRLRGFDAVAVVEVIEHLEPERLGAFVANLFADARPPTVVVTTPNVEYNALFDGLPAGTLRHRDHRFEWTRSEFADWCRAVCAEHGYLVEHSDIGPSDSTLGSPTQMAVFRR